MVRTHQYYFDGRESTCPYAYFDAKTWTAFLSLNQKQTGWAVVGVTSEELPNVIHVSSRTSAGIAPVGRNAALCIHIEYQTAEGYTKHMVYAANDINALRKQFAPWESKQITETVTVDDFSDFNIPFAAEAPEGFTGRAIITFELSSMGKGAKADIQLTPGSEDDTGVNEGLRTTNEALKTIDDATYDLQGRKIPDSKLSNCQIKKGVYIMNGKKTVKS